MSVSSPELDFRAVDEEQAGAKWRELFREFWTAYEEWFLREGDAARPSLPDTQRALRRYMPELVPTYERLVDLAGGGKRAARFLGLYRPTPFALGCAQAVWTRGEPALVRNYDYAPDLCDGVVLRSMWNGETTVVALTDCLWGVLDGMNEHGLAVALAFGGRDVIGDGFAVTLILRYVLETCATVADACETLRRVPSFMAYSVTLLDAGGDFATAFLSPDRPVVITRRESCTNHQGRVEWPEFERVSHSVEREHAIATRLADPGVDLARFVDAFLSPPLYRIDHEHGGGTLYTSVYRPASRRLELVWRDHRLDLGIADFREQVYVARYDEAVRVGKP